MERRRWPIGQCRVCLGWGELPQFADCVACSNWRHLHPDRTRCRRCGHLSHVNTDGLCRPCLLSIRADDPQWITNPRPGGSCQLGLILPGVRLPRAQPLDRPLRGRRRQDRPRSWQERVRVATAQLADDSRVCPPAPPGQLALFRLRRWLTDDHERRIRDRDLPGQVATKTAALSVAAERGLSISFAHCLARTTRLALAVRDADGHGLVAPEALDDLPRFPEAVAEVLRRTEMLGTSAALALAPTRRRAGDRTRARSCLDCGCWAVHPTPRCAPCQGWRFTLKNRVGVCTRCRRAGSPVRDGRCRACCVHVDEHGPETADDPGTQLWLGGDLALKLHNRAGALGYTVPQHRARRRAAARREPPPPVSPHLVDPGQPALLEARRDWSCVPVGALERLPTLTPTAQALLEEFQRYAHDHAWDVQVRRLAARSLRIVLAWVGADAPIPEADVRALPLDRPGTSARRVVAFLAERGLLVADPIRELDAHEQAVDQRIATLPEPIGDELRRWVQVLRGEGRRPHPARSFETIRKYLGYAHPVLHSWSQRVTSLREITPGDVHQALAGKTGNSARDLLTALNSLFRALKQERVVFRDPTRGVSLPAVRNLPAPIPTDRLRGLIDRAGGPMGRLVVALVAVHGLGVTDLTGLSLEDLDLATGRLAVPRDGARYVAYLDELTHTVAAAWLRERHRRWPVTTNPHLLITQQTAAMATDPLVSRLAINLIFEALGLRPSKLRQDRILDEARHSADPIHLMRIFRISDRTAMRYVYTAHPERRSTVPR